MLSYQHSYHAGNLADVHKHAILSWVLNYLTKKDKPLSYIETHAGRGLYDLASEAAAKTGEAAKGIEIAQAWFKGSDPYIRALAAIRARHGKDHYPGSPLIAQSLLRPCDHITLAELHPQEVEALRGAIRAGFDRDQRGATVKIHHQDGFDLAQSLCPPDPRRGLILIDPSWEIKSDYNTVPDFMASLSRKWNVGVQLLWYPVLRDGTHVHMTRRLSQLFPDALCHEVKFPPARDGHRMIGSGMFIVNAPWGLDVYGRDLTQKFRRANS
ncbi:MAG: 23S rRNA (adenine(2030)-N(6))-methyltransferase RlmJ [Pelagimonas sp.]|jgi:23S rRNA (adenine2030-N6)-methyltransferase|nr:23S rRNA (adenine(2030)-N(6))-methyltransferase RlmJ [Pelagimonas sp.]